MLKILTKLIAPLWSPKGCYRFFNFLKPFAVVMTLFGLGYGLFAGLVLAPADYQQGDCFRIIYIHVPFAFLSLMLYAAIGVLSLIYIIWRIKVADWLAMSIAPIGAMFAFLALVTGAIWGKPMWGTWWIWDARLTSELILFFLYLGYIALYSALQNVRTQNIAPAILAVVGLVDLPIIHYSVYWWHTLHQGATISKFSKPAMANDMLYPLLAMLIGTLGLTIWMVGHRIQMSILQQSQEQSWCQLEVKS